MSNIIMSQSVGGLIRRDIKPTTVRRVSIILTWKSRSAFNKRNPKTFCWKGRPHVTWFILLSTHWTWTVKLWRNCQFTFWNFVLYERKFYLIFFTSCNKVRCHMFENIIRIISITFLAQIYWLYIPIAPKYIIRIYI